MMPEQFSQHTRILAIETSCDETAAAVVEDGRRILSNVIASQTDLHAQYGGVFPEVASRKHVEVIHAVVAQALQEAHLSIEDLDCIAVTRGPGLVGSLLVGVNTAKGIALGRQKPLLGINHIEGHLYSLWLSDEDDQIEFPVLALVVSGGHTELYLMRDHLEYEHLGGTLDDAAGEAFDKVGRVLGLPFPGGPAIDKASENGDGTFFRFPRAVLEDSYNFSFSGLKTAVLRTIAGYDPDRLPVSDLAASFQAAVVDVLVVKTARAVAEYDVSAVHVSGGVSSNRHLRKVMAQRLPVPVRFPPPILCTDNAAMIAAAAHRHFTSGRRDSLDMDVLPSLQL
ncbi:MAG TPA: tRNA (adenosine(37)-N6)-threonylcarbamoyltransferase complex transferase subunit TsaD [Patescibacteria group bacterium]|nr:tRNA (adenosine(37)-N6)-threonylcarbamoyltransferase complex transferase subunit TsaD [Patescibacteria group bacterium]